MPVVSAGASSSVAVAVSVSVFSLVVSGAGVFSVVSGLLSSAASVVFSGEADLVDVGREAAEYNQVLCLAI